MVRKIFKNKFKIFNKSLIVLINNLQEDQEDHVVQNQQYLFYLQLIMSA